MVSEENDRSILGNVCKIADKLLHRLVRAAHERKVGIDLLILALVLPCQVNFLLERRIALALVAAVVRIVTSNRKNGCPSGLFSYSSMIFL